MLYIKATNITKYFLGKTLLEFDELSIFKGNRIGLIGVNGVGKTTLLNLLSSTLTPDKGKIESHCTISYFKQFDKDNTIYKNLSEGEKVFNRLEEIISQNSDIYFFDEPSAHLDIYSINLLKKKLLELESFILITHDRDLLKDLCNIIIEIKDSKLYYYNLTYDEYILQKEINIKTQKNEYLSYIKEKNRLELAYLNKINKINKVSTKKNSRESKVHNYLSSKPADKKDKSLHKSAKAILSRIDHLEKKDKPYELPKITMSFETNSTIKNKVLIQGKNVNFSYDKNIILKNATFNIFNGDKISIIGKNGSGKTTLLNLIINGSPQIKVSPNVKLGFLYQNFNNIDFNKTVIENVLMDSIQNQTIVRIVLARLLFNQNDINKLASVLSGGELIKLSFAKLLVSDVNVIIMDEPTNFLDLDSIEALQNLIIEYNGTIILVTHDIQLVNKVSNKVFLLENNTLTSFDGNYSEFTHYLNNSKKDNRDKILETEFKISQILSLLSTSNSNRAALEAEYEKLLAYLKTLKF